MKKDSRSYVPTRVCEVEVSDGIKDLNGLNGYTQALVLVRSHGVAVGCVRVAGERGMVKAQAIREAIRDNATIGDKISREVLMRWLMKHEPKSQQPRVSWSVVICTRNRADVLKRCLDSVMNAEGIESGEVIVVDNNPADDSTRKCVEQYPVCYLVEMRQGLNWARRCGARAARGEIVIFTDDDVRVDRNWIAAVCEPFHAPRVGAVAGLSRPAEIETPAQAFFDAYDGGHDRGFRRRVFDYATFTPAAAGQVGMGANMAFRRKLVVEMKVFDNELDAGTPTLSGGDTYAFYRILAAGFQVVYTPAALIWHYDRRDERSLRRMLYGYSVGGFAVLMRALFVHHDPQALKVAVCWLKSHHIPQLARALLRRPGALPLHLVLSEWCGVFKAPFAYWQGRIRERQYERA